jgi:sorting nexin-3/12
MASDFGGATNPDNSIKRLDFKHQTLDDAYAVPANLLEIEVGSPETHGLGRNRYTDYEVKMRVCIITIRLL